MNATIKSSKTPYRYIPAGAIERPHPAGLGVAYIGTNVGGRIHAIGYGGQRSKADWNYTFGTLAQVEAYIAKWFTGLEQSAAMKQERKQERTQPHNLTVGAVVYNSWGWEQTNIDFYQVVKVSTLYVWLRPIAADLSSAPGYSSMSGFKTPCPDQFLRDGEISQHRVTVWNNQPSIKFEFGSGSVYEGRALYCSWYG